MQFLGVERLCPATVIFCSQALSADFECFDRFVCAKERERYTGVRGGNLYRIPETLGAKEIWVR